MVSLVRNSGPDKKIIDEVFWNDYLPNERWGMDKNGDYVRKY